MQIRRLDAHQLAALIGLAAALFPGAALAFDCAKARTTDEKAICASPEARAADEAMTKAFEALRASASPAQRASILEAQVRWIGNRGQACVDESGAPFVGPKLSACLADASNARAKFLQAAPEAGPGASTPMAPFFTLVKGRKGRADVDFELVKFTSEPSGAERAFNVAVAKLSEEILQPDDGDPNADNYAFEDLMRVTYASPKLVSAMVNSYQNSGGAHPNSYIAHINVDLSAGKALSFADLADAKAEKAIDAKCTDEVRNQRKEKMAGEDGGGDDPFEADMAKNVAQSTNDLGAWGFGADKATIDYSPYNVGSYAEGYYACELPYAFLRPLVKPGFPLP